MFASLLLAAVLAHAPNAPNRPLVVLLHGDAQKPESIFKVFEAEAKARDVGLIAPECPVSEGCTAHSFWKWNGDPAWLRARAEESAKTFESDPLRTAYVGWSGGASYLGYRFQELGNVHSAVVFLGGGIAPNTSACVAPKAPVLFIVGDKNPLHSLARDLRIALDACAQPITWSLLPGADHAGEWRAVTSKARLEAIFEFVQDHPRTFGACDEGRTGAPPASANPSTALSISSEPPTTPPETHAAPAVPPVPSPKARAGCEIGEPQGSFAVLLALLATALRRRRKGKDSNCLN
jgi:predicted esterase